MCACVLRIKVYPKPNQTKLDDYALLWKKAGFVRAVYTIQSIAAWSLEKRGYNGNQGIIGVGYR